MNISDEFYEFCLYLHQDSAQVYGPRLQDWIDGALRHMREEQRAALGHYLDGLLAGGYSDAELEEIYRGTDAEIGIHNGLRHFLLMVRETVARNQALQAGH